ERLALLVRSPTQRHRDVRLRAAPAWTVRRLKAELRRLVPDAPPEEDQKLIYAGKLLLDHLYLRELLPKQGELHALHLVYNFRSPVNVEETNTEVLRLSNFSLSCAHLVFAGVEPALVWELYRCIATTALEFWVQQLETTQHPFQSVASPFSAYTTYSMFQMSWLQQMYARQYYLQYWASTAASTDLSHARCSQGIPEAPVTPPAPLPDPFPAQNQPGNQNAVAQADAVANQNLRMNAQGGPLMEEEEGDNRDWLDWLYSATLFYVFVNFIYFYSSVSRLLLVMGGTVLMYLHRVGWLPFRRRQVRRFPGDVPQAAVNQDQNNNLQGGNAGRADEPEASPGERQVLRELRQANPSFMSTAWVFFKTFFASLLPE
ncbi:HERP1 protein, partial [Steatornis caripensis]|nr:HERP1 protein [Steatornis caripensis]